MQEVWVLQGPLGPQTANLEVISLSQIISIHSLIES